MKKRKVSNSYLPSGCLELDEEAIEQVIGGAAGDVVHVDDGKAPRVPYVDTGRQNASNGNEIYQVKPLTSYSHKYMEKNAAGSPTFY